MQLKDVRASLIRHWPIVAVILLLIPIAVATFLLRRDTARPPARYTTSADVLIPSRDAKTGSAPGGVPPVLLQGQIELAMSSTTRSAALQAAKISPTQSRGVTFNAQLNDRQDIMTLTVSAPRPEVASDVLHQFIVAYADGRRQSVLDAAVTSQDIERRFVDALTKKLSDVDGQLVSHGVSLAAPNNDGQLPVPFGVATDTVLLINVHNQLTSELHLRQQRYAVQVTQAVIPAANLTVVQRRNSVRVTPPPPSPLVPLLEIVGIGLLLALVVPVLIDRFDRTITDERSASALLRTRVLGTIPAVSRRMQRRVAPGGSSWELAFRSLAATSISTDSLPKALMVSAPTGTMQDFVAANLAVAFGSLGLQVALVGTTPRQTWFLQPFDDELDEIGEGGTDEPAELGPVTGGAADVDLTGQAGGGSADPTGPVGGIALAEREPSYPTFVDLLTDAESGQLQPGFRADLAPLDGFTNISLVPPDPDLYEFPLDGLPPLLDAFEREGFDIALIAAPSMLEDPHATIIAWSTRSVLWVTEIGHIDKRDAQLAADRLEIAGVDPFGVAVVLRYL